MIKTTEQTKKRNKLKTKTDKNKQTSKKFTILFFKNFHLQISI